MIAVRGFVTDDGGTPRFVRAGERLPADDPIVELLPDKFRAAPEGTVVWFVATASFIVGPGKRMVAAGAYVAADDPLLDTHAHFFRRADTPPTGSVSARSATLRARPMTPAKSEGITPSPLGSAIGRLLDRHQRTRVERA